jgi:hypothetical protein
VGPIAEGDGGGTLSNSQCPLTGRNTAANLSGAGNPSNLDVPFTITFKNTFAGSKTAWGFAQTYGGAVNGPTNLGIWTP